MILFDHCDAVSFNDESSPNTLGTSRTKVCVNAQVIRDSSLDWYRKLLSFFPDCTGELKSALVVRALGHLPVTTRREVWSGLSRVRIHVFDPRPYRTEMHDMLKRIWRRNDAPEVLRAQRQAGNPQARWLSNELDTFVANSILRDSTAVRLQSLARALADPFAVLGRGDFPFFDPEIDDCTPLVDAAAFGQDRALLRKVTSWSAKSAAAFHSALDSGLNLGDEGECQTRFVPEFLLLRRMAVHLSPTHVFDEGDKKQIKLLEKARHALLSELSASHWPLTLVAKSGFVQVDSEESPHVQAADLAAGIASDIYASSGLFGVVVKFEYVSFNGIRASLSEAEIEQELRKLR